MPRVKGGMKTRRRRKKLLKRARGYYGARSKLYSMAKQASEHALLHAYKDRRTKKREFRKLWIMRINAAARSLGMTYNQFIYGLKKANISLNRKALAYLAYHDPPAFNKIAETVKKQIA